MLVDHAVHYRQDFGMFHDTARGDIVATFLNECGKARLLFGSVANGLRYKPRPTTALFRNDLVDHL